MTPTPSLSIVIPVLDDAHLLDELLADLDRQRDVEVDTIIVDGGSRDDPKSVASRHGARFFSTDAGRATQMNSGADRARFETLLFLHADCRLVDPWMLNRAVTEWRRRQSEHPDTDLAAHFEVEFVDGEGRRIDDFFYRFLAAKSKLCRPFTFNGDQGLLIAADFFDDLGGFDESLPFLEDQRIDRRIRRRGDWIALDEKLRTSARRFEAEGKLQRYALMAVMMGALAVDFDALFEALPTLYVPHDETQPLEIGELMVRIFRFFNQLSLRRRWDLFLGVGRFVRQNAWQIFLALDVADTGPSRYLQLYDRFVADQLDRRSLDIVAGALTFIFFFAVIPAVDEKHLLPIST